MTSEWILEFQYGAWISSVGFEIAVWNQCLYRAS